jgi:hypothetical protein
MTLNTVFTPTRHQKPTHKSQTAAGMREHKRWLQAKKASVLRLNERKKLKKVFLYIKFKIICFIFSRYFNP